MGHGKMCIDALRQYFYYDESSPARLKWKVDVGTRIKANSSCGTLKSDLHWRVTLRSKHYYCHRIVWELHNGEIPEGMLIDHIDGDSTNNLIANLRIVDHTENTRNAKMRKDNTSGVKGVSILTNKDKSGNPYSYLSAYVEINGKRLNKRFPLSKYSYEEALKLATDWRVEKLKEIGGYTERHIGITKQA